MTATGDIGVRHWTWLLLPWVAAAIAALGFAFLPSADCTGGPTADRSAFVAFALVAVAILVGGAVVRTVHLALGAKRPSSREWFSLMLCAALSIYYAVAYLSGANFGVGDGSEAFVIVGFVSAPLVYGAMAISMVEGKPRVPAVLTPISFLFVAAMLVAPVASFGYVLPEGGFC